VDKGKGDTPLFQEKKGSVPFSDELALTAVAVGTRMRLRVKPGARMTAIIGIHGGALKLAVSAPPDKGKANRAVVQLLAKALGVPSSAVTIAAGDASQDKVVDVALAPAAVRAILGALERPWSP
jgi:uncharacterized protein (TIGR00251 family)